MIICASPPPAAAGRNFPRYLSVRRPGTGSRGTQRQKFKIKFMPRHEGGLLRSASRRQLRTPVATARGDGQAGPNRTEPACFLLLSSPEVTAQLTCAVDGCFPLSKAHDDCTTARSGPGGRRVVLPAHEAGGQFGVAPGE